MSSDPQVVATQWLVRALGTLVFVEAFKTQSEIDKAVQKLVTAHTNGYGEEEPEAVQVFKENIEEIGRIAGEATKNRWRSYPFTALEFLIKSAGAILKG